MSQIRSFLAIDLDDDFKPKVNKIIKEFKKIDANIKFVDLNNLHFTLKFFGDIDTEGIDLISKKIEKVADDFEPFNIKISGCGMKYSGATYSYKKTDRPVGRSVYQSVGADISSRDVAIQVL